MRVPRPSLGLGSLMVAVLIVLAVGVGSAIAAIPNADGKFYACRVTKTGVVRVINYPKVSTCPPGQKLISWNAVGPQGAAGPQGPAGAQGPAGPAGPAGITKMFFTNAVSPVNTLPGNTATFFDFACPAGRASGGGFYTPSPADVQIYGSLPQGNNQWRVWARNTSAAARSVYIWIQCVTTDPGTVVANKKAQPSKKAIAKAGGTKNPR